MRLFSTFYFAMLLLLTVLCMVLVVVSFMNGYYLKGFISLILVGFMIAGLYVYRKLERKYKTKNPGAK